MNEEEKIKTIADNYGFSTQSNISIEEMVDVWIMLCQLDYLLGFRNRSFRDYYKETR